MWNIQANLYMDEEGETKDRKSLLCYIQMHSTHCMHVHVCMVYFLLPNDIVLSNYLKVIYTVHLHVHCYVVQMHVVT